jgi:hypothetical protein
LKKWYLHRWAEEALCGVRKFGSVQKSKDEHRNQPERALNGQSRKSLSNNNNKITVLSYNSKNKNIPMSIVI